MRQLSLGWQSLVQPSVHELMDSKTPLLPQRPLWPLNGKQARDQSNAIANLPAFPGIKRLAKRVFWIVDKSGIQKFTTQPLVGDEFVSFIKVFIVVFEG